MTGADLSIVDTTDPAAEVVARLDAAGWRMSTAESCTAGELTARLAAVPGSGSVLAGGLVAYHRDIKHALLGVPDGPVVSRPAAEAMARGVRRLLGTAVGVSVTGAVGPEGQDGRPPGTIHVAVDVHGEVGHREVALAGEPEQVRSGAVDAALLLLHSHLVTAPEGARS